MGGKTLDQFNSRQQARAKKMTTHDKDTNVREQDELDTSQTQTNQNQHKAKY